MLWFCVFLRWTWKTVCHHWWGFSTHSAMGFDHLYGFLRVWLACSRVHMHSISVSLVQCLACSALSYLFPDRTAAMLCKHGLMCPGAPVTMSCEAVKLLAYVGCVIALLPVWHFSLHSYWLRFFPMNSEVLLAVTRKQIKQSNSTASETDSWGTPL